MDDRINELANMILDYAEEFRINHEKSVLKGNMSAARRARKALGEIRKLVTEYRKESIALSGE